MNAKNTYGYMGYFPYGAGELFVLDNQVEDGFTGNIIEQIISEGLGEFRVIDENRAVLKLTGSHLSDISFVRTE